MTTVLLFGALIIVFITGLISPHVAGKIQRRADEGAGRLKRFSNWLWDPVTWWSKKSIEFSRKALAKAADWGKKAHDYLLRK